MANSPAPTITPERLEEIRAPLEKATPGKRAALGAQPCTAENPNEDSYARGYFNGVMAYGEAIAALPTTKQEPRDG